MGKHKGYEMDGETERGYNGWGNKKGMECIYKHKGKGMDEETQKE